MDKILFFTGAGISAESGVPTFRTGDNALWNNTKISDVCDISTFHQNKQLVFDFYNNIKQQYAKTMPNKAHEFIAQTQKHFGNDKVKIYTSNIDLLHEKAGAQNVVHVHGCIDQMNCAYCFKHWPINDEAFTPNTVCPFCGRYKFSKPGVTFFGEQAPAYKYLLNDFLPDPTKESENVVKIIIGSSLEVVNEFHLAPQYGLSILVDPNPQKTHLFDIVIPKTATHAIPKLQEILF